MRFNRRVALLTSIFLPENNRMTFSGADRYFVNLYKLLEELGYEPCVWQVGTKKLEFEGMRIEGIPCENQELGGLPELNLQFFERTCDYDQTIYFAPFLAFPRVKPRSVVISHGIAWDYPSHPWSTITGPLYQEWLRRFYYAFTAPDLFVSVDTNTLNWIRATWPGYESKQVYIPNFVDPSLFFPRDEASREKVIILYPRRLTWIRGLDDVKAAARKLTERYDFVEFHFVGRAGNDAAEAEMRKWTEENPHCRYYWVPMAEMPEIYRQADIVLIPTRAGEGTSLSCIEAMASGKAVVSSWVGGLSNLIIDQYNGLLIDINPENLEKAIDDLIRNPEKRRRLGEKALETATVFSIELWKKRWTKALGVIWGGELHESEETTVSHPNRLSASSAEF